ncbi:NrtR DNA-binding winged helix domain-containing protein [Fodinibius sediminis]|uniref:NrtR DNA-binding winged helix domain-containing protein n=1 Tax=Fodinibius sediminis TaxID=1214077 RepID=UPI001157FBA4|nr:hypothetical protein [Fodinibius sediminis]
MNRSPGQARPGPKRMVMKENGLAATDDHWLLPRFISVGYGQLQAGSAPTVLPLSQLPVARHRPPACPAPESSTHYCPLQKNIDHKTISLNLLDEVLTMSDLQNLYGIMLDKKLNRAGFHRTMTNAEHLERMGKKITPGCINRPVYTHSLMTGPSFAIGWPHLDKLPYITGSG